MSRDVCHFNQSLGTISNRDLHTLPRPNPPNHATTAAPTHSLEHRRLNAVELGLHESFKARKVMNEPPGRGPVAVPFLRPMKRLISPAPAGRRGACDVCGACDVRVTGVFSRKNAQILAVWDAVDLGKRFWLKGVVWHGLE